MLEKWISVGDKVYFQGYVCEVLAVLSEIRLLLSQPVVDGQVELLPLFSQGMCEIESGEIWYRTRAEVCERYRANNRYVMEIEFKQGLYRVLPEKNVQEDESGDVFEDQPLSVQKKQIEQMLG